MYRMDRTRKCKVAFGISALIFFVMCILGYGFGGKDLLEYGWMNDPLAGIVMVAAFFCTVICTIAFFTVHALEKDIAEWLEIVDKE